MAECVVGGLVTDASGARSICPARVLTPGIARSSSVASDQFITMVVKRSVERSGWKWARMLAKVICVKSVEEIVVGRQVRGSGAAMSTRASAAGCVRRASAPLAEPARISIRRAAPTALRNRRLCKARRCQLAARYTAGRKSGTRRSGAAARAASARPAIQWSAHSVVTVSLLER